MRHILLYFFVGFLAVVSAPSFADTLYLAEIGNIPMFPDASIIENSSVVFDKPAGRIAEVHLMSFSSKEDIINYYRATLPSLGWKATNPTVYIRENERLSIKIDNNNGKSFILFRIAPNRNSP